MLETHSHGFTDTRFTVVEHGLPITEFAGLRRESATFVFDGWQYRAQRVHAGRFSFAGPTGHLCDAYDLGKRTWRLDSGLGQALLRRPSAWRSTWELWQDGALLGTVRRANGRGPYADLRPELGQPMRLFVLYLVLVLYLREQSAAVAAAVIAT